MELKFNGKVVIVTGASKGIGLACAQAFLREGAKVALVSRSRPNLDAALAGLSPSAHKPMTIVADLTRADDAARMVAEVLLQFGPVDVLVNSAGAAKRTAPDDLTAQAWHDAMDAKFFSYVHPSDIVIKQMAARGRGAIVNIIGMGGKVAGNFHIAGGAANAALMLATAGLASAYAGKGVRVNGINPGLTMTSRVEEGVRVEARALNISEAEVLKRAQARIPMGRGAAPEEIARLAVFLASS